MKQKRKLYFCTVLLILCVTQALTACSGGAKRDNYAAATTAASNEMAAPQETAAYTEEGEYAEAAAAPASGGSLTDGAPLSQAAPANRKLIRNVNMSVETDTFDPLIKNLTDKVSELGGYVEQSEVSGNSLNQRSEPVPRYAALTVRIPMDKLDSFITVVENNGNVTNKSESTQDVTLQYSDLESRKKSLTVEQERIWALLEKADTLEAVITLEERLSEIRYELESMESQLRLYDNQVDYSTLYLSINEIVDSSSFTPTEPEGFGQRIQNGFAKNMRAVTQGWTNFFIWLVTSSPFWIPLAAVAGIIILILQRYKRKLPLKPERKSTHKPDVEKKDTDNTDTKP